MERIIFYSICLILFLIPIIFDTHLYSVFDLPKLMVLYGGVIFASLFLCLHWLKGNKIVVKKNKLSLLILLWVSISILATIFSCNPRVSIFGLFRHYEGLTSLLSYLVIFFVVYQYGLKRESIFIKIIIFTALLTSIYGLIQHLGLDPISWVGCGGRYRLSASFGNPVFFSAYLALVLPLSLKFALEKRGITFFFSSLIFAFLCWTFLMTNTRACIVGLTFGICFFLFYLGKDQLKKYFKKLAFLGLIGLIITIILNLNPQTSFLLRFRGDMVLSPSHAEAKKAVTLSLKQSREKEKKQEVSLPTPPLLRLGGSSALRILLWRDVIDIVKDFPLLGTGVDTLGLIYLKYRHPKVLEYEGDSKADSAHNELLDMASSRGILGTLIYIWLFLTLFLLALKNRSLLPPKEKLLVAVCMSSIITYLVQAQFSFGITPVLSLFWAIMGLSLTAQSFKPTYYSIKLNKLQKFKPIIYLLLMILPTIFIYLSFRAYMADLSYRRASLLKDRIEERIWFNLLESSKRWNPWEGWYREEYERALLEKVKNNKEEIIKVIKEFEKTTKLFPQSSNAYNTLGLLYYYAANLGHQPELYRKLAIKAFLKAVNYNPLYAGAYNNLGIIYSSLNEYDKTLLYFTKGLKVDKNSSVSVENLSKLAELFLYRNEWEKAARCYEAIINLASNLEKEQRYKLLVKLAQLYYEKIKNFAKFENLCKRMIAEFPDYREPYVNLVKFYYLNSKYSKARKILDKLEEKGLMDKEAERLKRLIS